MLWRGCLLADPGQEDTGGGDAFVYGKLRCVTRSLRQYSCTDPLTRTQSPHDTQSPFFSWRGEVCREAFSTSESLPVQVLLGGRCALRRARGTPAARGRARFVPGKSRTSLSSLNPPAYRPTDPATRVWRWPTTPLRRRRRHLRPSDCRPCQRSTGQATVDPHATRSRPPSRSAPNRSSTTSSSHPAHQEGRLPSLWEVETDRSSTVEEPSLTTERTTPPCCPVRQGSQRPLNGRSDALKHLTLPEADDSSDPDRQVSI